MLPGIQPARGVLLIQVAQDHHHHGSHRQRHQHADEAEELAAGHHRKDHRHRVHADPVSDQERRQHHAFERLPDREHQPHQQHVGEVAVLHHRRDQAGTHAHDGSEVGNEAHQSGHHSDQERQIDARHPQPDRIDRTQRHHDAELAAQKAAEHAVGLARQARDHGLDPARDQQADLLHHHVPVAQQVEGHHRDQRQVHQPADDHHARARDAAQHRGGESARLFPVVAQHAIEVFEVESLDFHAGALGDPGQHGAGEPLAIARELVDEGRNLPLQQRDQQQHHAHQSQGHQQEHDDDRPAARQAQPLQPIHHRIAKVGEQRGDHERRQHRTQRPQQQADPEHQRSQLPLVLVAHRLLHGFIGSSVRP